MRREDEKLLFQQYGKEFAYKWKKVECLNKTLKSVSQVSHSQLIF